MNKAGMTKRLATTPIRKTLRDVTETSTAIFYR
jgi:hypothetical protein